MNILLIEDNKVMSKSLKYSLETNNYKVIALERIKASKEYLNTKPQIDLVILDINLPDGTGYDLYEQTIKKIQIPTIFLTARDDENDSQALHDAEISEGRNQEIVSSVDG